MGFAPGYVQCCAECGSESLANPIFLRRVVKEEFRAFGEKLLDYPAEKNTLSVGFDGTGHVCPARLVTLVPCHHRPRDSNQFVG